MSSDLITIEKNVYILLLKYPKLRSIYQRKRAIFNYWQMFEGVNIGVTERQFVNLTNPETISRAIRKVLNDNPKLKPSQELETKRYEKAEEFRSHYQKVDKRN